MSPSTLRLAGHEQVPGPVSLVLGVIACHPSGGSLDGRTHLPSQLPGGLVETHYRTLRIVLRLVQVQHVLHPRHELPAQPGEPKERTFESSFVLALRKPRRGAGARWRTGNDGKRKTAKAQNIGETAVQTALPINGLTEREAASPQQIKPTAIRAKPRARRRVNKDLQRSFLPDPPPDSSDGQ